MAIHRLGEPVPDIAPSAWVAESAQVIGELSLANEASAWYGAVLQERRRHQVRIDR